jgi:hypothetical protein
VFAGSGIKTNCKTDMGKKKAALILAAMDTKKVKDLCQTLAKESQNIS